MQAQYNSSSFMGSKDDRKKREETALPGTQADLQK